MKKSVIATLSAVAMLGAGITGASWYTGKQVETHYLDFIAQANQQLKVMEEYGIEGELKNVEIERGLFSSAVHYTLEVKQGDDRFHFNGNDTLFHGPLPLNRLMQGKVLPVLASIETHIAMPAQWHTQSGQPEWLSGESALSYGGDYSGEFMLPGVQPLKLPVEWRDVNIAFELDKQGNGKLKSNAPSVTLLSSAGLIAIEGLEYEMRIDHNNQFEALALGDFEGKAKSITLKAENPSQSNIEVIFSDVNAKSEGKIKESDYTNTVDFKGKIGVKTPEDNLELGKLSFAMFSAMDAQASNDVETLSRLPATNDYLYALWSKPFKLHLKEVQFENHQGRSEFSLILNSKGLDPQTEVESDKILAQLQQSSLDLKVDLASIEEFFKQMLLLNPETRYNAQVIAKAQLDAMVAAVRASGMAEINEKIGRIKIEVDQGNVRLNGNEVSEQQVQKMLFILGLGLAQGLQ